ncbi:Alpha-galactosidase [subsurface metagenome]
MKGVGDSPRRRFGMAKIVLIGAGSHVFSRRLILDILSYPELRDSAFTLMDIDKEPLDLITAFAKKLVEQHGFKTQIESTINRREALEGADYVIVAIRVGGLRPWQADVELSAKYGVKQAVGDTIGPGGVFYGLRHIPVILDICHDMEELCPDAWLLNYTNPMAILCWAINDYTRIKNVGLCHSVQHTSEQLASYLGVPYDEMSYWVAGINHMAWFLELKWRGKDAYPLLREKFKDPEIYSRPDVRRTGPDIVRAEIFKAFGYFSTEGSKHMSEYVPYFRKRPELIERFKLLNLNDFETRAKMKREGDEELRQQLSTDQKFPISHSGEYASIIIRSIETGTPSRINGNVRNNGLITNLLEGCCVEVPCLVDKKGISPCYVGNLPPQLAALNRTNINVQELAVKGIVEKDKTKIFQSILLDPLTSAILTIDETQQMVDEMFQVGAEYLKGFT